MSARAHGAKILRPHVQKRLGIANWMPYKSTPHKTALTYKDALHVDIKVRSIIEKHFSKIAVLGVNIERTTRDKFCATILTNKIDAIVQDEANLNTVKRLIKEAVGVNKEAILNIQEPNYAEILPQLYARELVYEIENKGNLKAYVSKLFMRIKNDIIGIKGIRIIVKGRLSGSTMARVKIYSHGSVSKKIFNAHVDEYVDQALTNSGTCGVRVTLQVKKTDIDRLFDNNIKEKNAYTRKKNF